MLQRKKIWLYESFKVLTDKHMVKLAITGNSFGNKINSIYSTKLDFFKIVKNSIL